MKIIVAPAKKMKIDTDSFPIAALPQYLSEAEELLLTMRQLSYSELKTLWQCSDKIAQTNYDWLQQMALKEQLTPALLAFSGIQYQYMAPDVFTAPALTYVQANLRILSGFYGILRPFDGVVPYRLEMQARLKSGQSTNLYDFWGAKPYQALHAQAEPIINLASQEYAKIIQRHLQPNVQLIDVVFGHWVDGKIKTRATLAKMARGEMVRFMAENNIKMLADLRRFDRLNYHYTPELSAETKLVFVKQQSATNQI
ncbi:peroxide stress protein YaaA [Loigolactobacillus iwatensis]|uniref:peroxide stress protein YaaA n=1 Tax=Loigolactobacillus iwatensis TaxID=1267156 RepID=UPI000F7D72BF|nr:peroxide stress protein YaaA [Loigolactobacillus iwatensis]